jgi:hypothetical protein
MCSCNSVIRQAPPELPTELWNAQDRSKDKAKACVPTLRDVFTAENEDTLMAMAVTPCVLMSPITPLNWRDRVRMQALARRDRRL